jgi:hypothetical protein
MIPKKPAPDLIRGGYRFSEKIMLNQEAKAKFRFNQNHFALAMLDSAGWVRSQSAWFHPLFKMLTPWREPGHRGEIVSVEPAGLIGPAASTLIEVGATPTRHTIPGDASGLGKAPQAIFSFRTA